MGADDELTEVIYKKAIADRKRVIRISVEMAERVRDAVAVLASSPYILAEYVGQLKADGQELDRLLEEAEGD